MSELRMLKAKILADGRIDDQEVEIIRHELYTNDRIDKEDIEVLIELRREARSISPSFEGLFFEAIRSTVLVDGTIDTEEALWLRQMLFAGRLSMQGRLMGSGEAHWLRRMLFANGAIDHAEREFLSRLNQEAKHVSPEFRQLYDECMEVPSLTHA